MNVVVLEEKFSPTSFRLYSVSLNSAVRAAGLFSTFFGPSSCPLSGMLMVFWRKRFTSSLEQSSRPLRMPASSGLENQKGLAVKAAFCLALSLSSLSPVCYQFLPQNVAQLY